MCWVLGGAACIVIEARTCLHDCHIIFLRHARFVLQSWELNASSSFKTDCTKACTTLKREAMVCWYLAVAQKTGTKMGTLVSGNMDQNLRFAPPG